MKEYRISNHAKAVIYRQEFRMMKFYNLFPKHLFTPIREDPKNIRQPLFSKDPSR